MGFFGRLQSRKQDPVLTEQTGDTASGVVGPPALLSVTSEESGHVADGWTTDVLDMEAGDAYGRSQRSGLNESQGEDITNPNVMGNERIIMGGVFAEEENPGDSMQVLSPEMDAFIQNQMAEQAQTEQEKVGIGSR